MEVEVLQVLELGLAGREQLLADLNVGVHRAADIEQDQQLHRVAPLRSHLNVEQASIARGVVDGAVDVQFVRRALTGELAQAAQGDLDVARTEFDLIVEVLVFALVPDLHRLALAFAGIADADAFGVVAAGAERAGAAGTDPLVAAGMAFLLLFETLLELLDQLVQPAEGLDLRTLLVRQAALELLAQPVFGDQRFEVLVEILQALEVGTEGPVELVEVALVLTITVRARK